MGKVRRAQTHECAISERRYRVRPAPPIDTGMQCVGVKGKLRHGQVCRGPEMVAISV
jgi:hypothetical protein